MPKPPTLPYSKAVVDNGPLFALLTLVFLRQYPEHRGVFLNNLKLEEYVLRRETDFLEFFASIKQLRFTSHVVGEMKRRRKLKRPEVAREFWLCSINYLKYHHVEERLLTLISLDKDDGERSLLYNFGPVDAGLILLARQEQCVLLTDDSGLLSGCDKQGNPDIQLVQNVL
jgi:hypothetical protein